jgi:hypothetical protein
MAVGSGTCGRDYLIVRACSRYDLNRGPVIVWPELDRDILNLGR